jgi:hypothetical protein
MEPSIVVSFYKLAVAGEQAGFSLEDMISLLDAGLTVETLLDLIERRLTNAEPMKPCSTRWVM